MDVNETITLVVDVVIESYRYHVKRTIVNVQGDAVTLLDTIKHHVRMVVKSRVAKKTSYLRRRPLEIKINIIRRRILIHLKTSFLNTN